MTEETFGLVNIVCVQTDTPGVETFPGSLPGALLHLPKLQLGMRFSNADVETLSRSISLQLDTSQPCFCLYLFPSPLLRTSHGVFNGIARSSSRALE